MKFSDSTAFYNDDSSIRNGSSYELAFSKSNGSFLYINALPGGDFLTHEQLLWEVDAPNFERRGSQYYNASWTNHFEYCWNDTNHILTMRYIPDPQDTLRVQASVTVMANTGSWFDMHISITNEINDNIVKVFFPCVMLVMLEEEDEVIMPGGHPGILVAEPFFTHSE